MKSDKGALRRLARIVNAKALVLVCSVFFLLSGTGPDASAFQNSKKNRIYISKKKGKSVRRQQRDSLKAQRSQSAPARKKKARQSFRLGKPSFHGVVSGFRFLPQENAESEINFSAGVEMSFTPLRRLELFTGLGINYIDQNYRVDEGIILGRLSSGALLRREHVSTDIFVFGLEVPIGVRYRFKDSPNSLVVSAGLTTRTSFREKFEEFVNWQTGGFNGDDFIASAQRETSIFVQSPRAFEFLNLFSSGFVGLGQSFRVDSDHSAEIQLTYHFNLAGTKNIFQEVRFKKYESIGITLKFPLTLFGL